MNERDAFDLETAFSRARAEPPMATDGLLARITADALALRRPVRRWRSLLAAIGGPAGAGGLVTATVAGFWLGFAPPDDAVDPLVLIGAMQLADDDTAGLLGLGWDNEEG